MLSVAPDYAAIKTASRHNWRMIFANLGIDVPDSPKRHSACPTCGGEDRFRFDDEDGKGTWFCNQCRPQAGDGFGLIQNVRDCDFKTAVELVRESLGGHSLAPTKPHTNGTKMDGTPKHAVTQRQTPPEGELGKTVFCYERADGMPGFYVQRIEKPDGKKLFPQWGPTEDGLGWQANMDHAPKPRPLYRLPQILANPEAVVVFHEGEKAVHAHLAARLTGIPTTTSQGAEKAKCTDFSPLAGRHVVICPDHDEPGARHAQDLAARAHAVGAASVRIFRLTCLPAKGDVVEWLENGGTPEAFSSLLQSTAETVLPSIQPSAEAESVEEPLAQMVESDTAPPGLNGHPTLTVQSAEPDDAPTHIDTLGDFPEDAWRGPFKVYREAMVGTSEAPDTAHFSALWGVAAATLRRRASFYYAYPHFANVYLVNFGNTGDSKTSAGRQGLRLLPDEGVKLLRGVGSAEALGDWMQQSADGPAVSHLLFIEELATLLTRGGWEGSTLLSFLTETFDAPEKYEIPFRTNPVLVQEPTPTLIAGTTIEWLWKGLREIDVHGGFGNRIFYITGTPKPPIPLPAKPNPEALVEVRAHLHRLASLSPTELFFMPDAQALWHDFYMAWKTTTWSELTTAAIKRIPAYIVKLSMVYACLEKTSLITAEQLNAAIKVGHYGAKCADQLMNRHRQHSVQGKCEARVLAVLKDQDLPAWKIHRRISGSYTAEELGRAIRALESAGVIQEIGKTRRSGPIYGRRDRKREV